MKAITNLANVLKRKPLVTAQQEQKIRSLTQLVESTLMHGTLPRVPNQKQNSTVLRVHPKATLPRGPETTPGESTRNTQLKAAFLTTSDRPAAISQQTQRQKPQSVSMQQPCVAKLTSTPNTRAATAQDATLNAPLSSRTRSKTMGTAKAIYKQFTRMENKVHQALAVMDK